MLSGKQNQHSSLQHAIVKGWERGRWKFCSAWYNPTVVLLRVLRRIHYAGTVLVIVLFALSACNVSEGERAERREDPWNIVFVPAIEDPFYRAIADGASETADTKEVSFSVTDYPELWSVDIQKSLLESQDWSSVDAVLIGPTSTAALNEELRAVAERGVAVITVDTYVGDGHYDEGEDDYAVSYVGTDNWKGGRKVAEALAELVGKEGEVYVNTTHSDVSSVSDRVKGFIAGMAEIPNMQIVATDYNQDRQDIAFTQTLRRLQEYPDVRAVFATNLSSSQGANQAILESGLTGAVRIASWDSTEPIIQALERGVVDLVLAQSPREIGAEAVKLAIDHLEGRSVPDRVHVNAEILTLESVNELSLDELTY